MNNTNSQIQNSTYTDNQIEEVQIISIRRKTTSNAKTMWSCRTSDNRSVNIFDGSISYKMFERAGYSWSLEKMDQEETKTWHSYPIMAQIQKNGKWFEFVSVYPKINGAEPDEYGSIQEGFFQEYITKQCRNIIALGKDVVIWDVETTGLQDDDDIISIGAVYGNGENVFDGGNLYIKCNEENIPRLMSPEIQAVHGITWDHISEYPSFKEAHPLIQEKLEGKMWVAYNQQFDAGMLRNNCYKYNMSPISPLAITDAMILICEARRISLSGMVPTISLVDSANLLDIEQKDAHDAQNDAWMTWRIIDELAHYKKRKEPF